jgi:hypothetical protein
MIISSCEPTVNALMVFIPNERVSILFIKSPVRLSMISNVLLSHTSKELICCSNKAI